MNSPSVLVLDDDTAMCRIVRQMLSLESYQVRTSQSIEEAVAAIKEKPFDAYILDHRLREGSGLDLAERLRANGSNAPIVLISGYDLNGVAAEPKRFKSSILSKNRFRPKRFAARSRSRSSQRRLFISTRTIQSR